MTQPLPEAARAPAPANRRALALIVLIALALRLVVILAPNFENLMDANHIHGWEQGNVAEALLAGRGFGSPLASNQTLTQLNRGEDRHKLAGAVFHGKRGELRQRYREGQED